MDSEEQMKAIREEEGPLTQHYKGASLSELERTLPRLNSLPAYDQHAHGRFFRLTRRILDSSRTTAFMTVLTVYALFADDFRLSLTEKKRDDGFFACAVVCLFFFLIEIIAACWVNPPYRLSFNFWLDTVSTLSLIPDIGWIWAEMIGSSDGSTSSQINQIRNAGKMSRTGARTSRIVRIVRIIRIIRLVKLYKSAKSAIDKSKSLSSKVIPDEEYVIPQESKIGRKLADLTTRRVIVLVLVLLIVLPLFELSFYYEFYTSWEYGASGMNTLYGTTAFVPMRDSFINYHKDASRPLLFLSFTSSGMGFVWKNGDDLNELRLEEKYYVQEGLDVAIFDIRFDTKLEAGLNIIRTIFVCIVLSLGAVYLTKDANTLVIIPIEKMIDKVKRIAKNPVGILEENLLDVYDLEKKGEIKPKWWQRICCIKMNQPKELETSVLEEAILKIGTLLAISFGEAGARVIGENISQGNSINPMLGGKKVIAIFGFCDIRNFTDTTEVLQEMVMTFVNEIAHIVHHTAEHHLGTANKNIGDAFMLVWKFKESLYVRNGSDVELVSDSSVVRNIADLSIISFLKIYSKINRNPTVLKYREHVDLKRRIPGYSVRMGFSLHLGWAIEGAIGSELKIDASYLSPHVNIVMKLEELTKLYGVPLLVSGAVVSVCNTPLQQRCRHLDSVRTSSGVAVRVYTVDVNASFYTHRTLTKETSIKKKEESRSKHKKMMLLVENPYFTACEMMEKSRNLNRMTQGIPLSLIAQYNEAMQAFEHGAWGRTQALLESYLSEKHSDTPANVILAFLRQQGPQPPPDWLGSREFPK